LLYSDPKICYIAKNAAGSKIQAENFGNGWLYSDPKICYIPKNAAGFKPTAFFYISNATQ